MKFNIKHETGGFLLLAAFFPVFMVLSIILMSVAVTLNTNEHALMILVLYIVGLISSALSMLSGILAVVLYFSEQSSGTDLTIEDDYIQIKYMLKGKKKIRFADISDLQIERYTRYRRKKGGMFIRSHIQLKEERLKMTISHTDGTETILTDTASDFSNASGLWSSSEVKYLPDKDVPLYMAYTIMKTRI